MSELHTLAQAIAAQQRAANPCVDLLDHLYPKGLRMPESPPPIDHHATLSEDYRPLDLDKMPMDIGVEEIEAAERLGWYVTGSLIAEPPPLFPCAMTDIESLSLHPGNAFLLSQAVVPFRLTPEGPVMGPPLLLVFDLLEQLLSARHIDDKTRQFWRDQPATAHAHFADPDYVGHGGARPVRTTMGELATRLGYHLDLHCVPKGEVYSQGIAFDLSNLASAMFDAGDKTPWEYWAATDNRTLRRKLPKRRTAPKLDIPGAAHDPVYDCVKQIWALWEVATDEMLGVAVEAQTGASV